MEIACLVAGGQHPYVGHVALDGTKVQANASVHKAMSYGRMLETEKRLSTEVSAWFACAEATDAEEERAHGSDRRGDDHRWARRLLQGHQPLDAGPVRGPDPERIRRHRGEPLDRLVGVELQLTGVRGNPPSDLVSIEDTLLRLSQMVCDIPEISELDINPLIVHAQGEGCSVADSRIMLRRPKQ